MAANYDPLKDPIEIVVYDDRWPDIAREELHNIHALDANNIFIAFEHVGSTAIPGLCAKPIIDLYVAVKLLEEAKEYVLPLQEIGYVFWQDNPDKTRLSFFKGMPPFGEKRTHHLHITEINSDKWAEAIAFRDYLRQHAAAAREYGELKQKLQHKFRYDREGYTEAKTDFVQRVLNRTQLKRR